MATVLPLYIIDSFSGAPFSGSPTPVCLLDSKPANAWMHSVARELNYPVTAFLVPGPSNEPYGIFYFTTTGEIPACGHATLASAKFVFEYTGNASARFRTIERIIIESRLSGDIIFMKYPKYNTVACEVSEPILASLGIQHYRSAGICKELETLFIELDEPDVLRQLQPDYKAMVEANREVIEIVVTARSDRQGFDYLLRSFCPWIGIDEDPVTGSVHSVLAGFWKDRVGKPELRAWQASERGGEVFVKAYDDKVELGGRAVAVVKGELLISNKKDG